MVKNFEKQSIVLNINSVSEINKYLKALVNISKYGQRKNLSNNEKFIVVYQGDFTRFIVN